MKPKCLLARVTLLTAACAFWASATAATYFVSPNGSDRNLGDSDSPLRTIAEAAHRVAPGDTIELSAGRYSGATINRPGSTDMWITLRARQGEKAIVEGSGRGPTLYFYHKSCDEYAAPGSICQALYWSVENLEIHGSPDGGGDGNAVKIDTPSVKLVGNVLCCSTADVVKVVHTADDVSILGNEIHTPRARPGANAQGVDIVGAERTLVAENFVHDIPSIGMYAKGNAKNTVFERNRVERTWSHGIMLGQSTDAHRLRKGPYESYDGIVRDNLIRDTGWSCFATASSLNVRIYNNTCYNTGTETHGSILISNESEIGQAGTNIDIFNNVVFGSARHSMVKVTSNAMTDPSSLRLDHNVYWTREGAGGVRFSWRDRGLNDATIDTWRRATRNDTSSRIADPRFRDLKSLAPALTDMSIAVPSQRSVTGVRAESPRCLNHPELGARNACRP
ncbi:MAG: right-handed parallel beta-helix repeat-containing protein [Rhodocyclales bacterium]|nr:right-handed parallel beta-helix repeat-containing protein [Rhodocyclales bacterium]